MAYQNNSQNNNRRNNNKRYRSNNNSNRPRRNFGGVDEKNISPQQRRAFSNKRDSHMMKAKEFLASGDRVEAENQFQHAEHFYRMSQLGLENKPAPEKNKDNDEGDAQVNSDSNSENNSDKSASADSGADAQDAAPKKKAVRKPKPQAKSKKAAAENDTGGKVHSSDSEAKPDSDDTIGDLPFLQPPA